MKVNKLRKGKWYLGDCLDVMSNMESKKFKCVIIDPPYTMTKTGNSSRPNYMPGGEILDGVIPDMQKVFQELHRIMEDQSHIYVFCNINDIFKYQDMLKKAGFHFHNLLIMVKNTSMPNRWYMKWCEHVIFARKGKAYAINDKGSRDYIQVDMPTQRNGKIHPTQKPIDIIEKFITNSTQCGDRILDCFGGSGTTAIAAINTNRKWICIEKDKEYSRKAVRRILDHEKI